MFDAPDPVFGCRDLRCVSSHRPVCPVAITMLPLTAEAGPADRDTLHYLCCTHVCALSRFLCGPTMCGDMHCACVNSRNNEYCVIATGRSTSFASRGSGAAAPRRSWWTGTGADSSPTSLRTSCACSTPSRCGQRRVLGCRQARRVLLRLCITL